MSLVDAHEHLMMGLCLMWMDYWRMRWARAHFARYDARNRAAARWPLAKGS
jgi:hypothetical protein